MSRHLPISFIEEKVKDLGNDLILLRVNVSSASYTEKHIEKTVRGTLISLVKNNIYRWFQLSGSERNKSYQKAPVSFTSSAFTNNSN